jgi:hypothetical protein
VHSKKSRLICTDSKMEIKSFGNLSIWYNKQLTVDCKHLLLHCLATMPTSHCDLMQMIPCCCSMLHSAPSAQKRGLRPFLPTAQVAYFEGESALWSALPEHLNIILIRRLSITKCNCWRTSILEQHIRTFKQRCFISFSRRYQSLQTRY